MSAAYRTCSCGAGWITQSADERRCPRCRGRATTPDVARSLEFLPRRSRRREPRHISEVLLETLREMGERS
jgi:hypothetical protein